MTLGRFSSAVVGLLLLSACGTDAPPDDRGPACPARSAPLWDMDQRTLETQAWPGGDGFETVLERGVALYRQERFPQAAANFERAATLAPACPEPLVLSGRAQVAAVRSGTVGGDDPRAAKMAMQEAVATFDRAIAVDPNLAEAYRQKARALFIKSTGNPLKLPLEPPAPIFKALQRAMELEPEDKGTERFFITAAAGYADALLSFVRIARDQENEQPARALGILLLRMRITDYYLKTFLREAAERNESYLAAGAPGSVGAQLKLLAYLAEFDRADAVFERHGNPEQESPVPAWRTLMTEARQPIEVKTWDGAY